MQWLNSTHVLPPSHCVYFHRYGSKSTFAVNMASISGELVDLRIYDGAEFLRLTDVIQLWMGLVILDLSFVLAASMRCHPIMVP